MSAATRLRALLGLATLLALATLAAQAATEPLAEGLRRCAGESDQPQRLACFDALAATLPRIEADQFGLTADIARKRDPATEHRAEEAVLPGKIVALRQAPRGEWIFTLDNQQVWMQAESEQSKRFAVGEAVHIEHGAMGSLWLAADKGRKTRVKRIS
jgi:hypothetical protein